MLYLTDEKERVHKVLLPESLVSSARESSLQFMSLRVDFRTSSSPLKSKRMEGDFALVFKGTTKFSGCPGNGITPSENSSCTNVCTYGNAAGCS